jgi:predicted RNase H-like HicB family nuclease
VLVVNQYPAVIDGERGAYGVVIPDMLGACCAMGNTVDEALQNAETALAEFVMALEEDGQAVPPPSAIEDVVLADMEMVAYVTLKIPVTT